MATFGRSAGFAFGMGVIGLTASLLAVGCAAPADDLEPSLTVADELELQGKPAAPAVATSVTMTCTQPLSGCVPTGYRHEVCTVSGLKARTNVVICVKAGCPGVRGGTYANGETCYQPVQVARDGTASAFFAFQPDATYEFVAHSETRTGSIVASTTATPLSSVAENTQCAGPATGCN